MNNNIEFCRESLGTKYDHVLHENIYIQLTGIANEAEREHDADEINFDMFRLGLSPIEGVLKAMAPKYTKDLAEFAITQVILSCRIMGMLNSNFYTSKLFALCETFIIEISNDIDVYESTLSSWLTEAKSKPELC